MYCHVGFGMTLSMKKSKTRSPNIKEAAQVLNRDACHLLRTSLPAVSMRTSLVNIFFIKLRKIFLKGYEQLQTYIYSENRPYTYIDFIHG